MMVSAKPTSFFWASFKTYRPRMDYTLNGLSVVTFYGSWAIFPWFLILINWGAVPVLT